MLINKKNNKLLLIASIIFVLMGFNTFSQTKISGKINDSGTKETLAGVNIAIKGKVVGTTTDAKGDFSLTTTVPTPFTILVSMVGYQSQEVNVTGSSSVINISMTEQAIMGQEVVVSASRYEEKVMKSAVAVEKMDIRAIQQSATPSFYDALANYKGVDMTTQGLLFKSINMRGFGSTGNPRTVQMIDGMDNNAPGLNFPVDNIVGMPELDVESVEVLPGAASALYGPNAINGLVLMNSKSPFLYQGLSAVAKVGVMSADNRKVATTPFYDFSIRYAKAINNKFAYKINLANITAKDWESSNYANLNIGGSADPTRGAGADSDYDGVNTYGDETRRAISGTQVTRTGLYEQDLVDYGTKSFKGNLALHYRVSDKAELIGQVNYGKGTTVYTGTGKYALRNFNLSQIKLELKGDNYTLRGYTTQENSGESYTAGVLALAMQNSVKSDNQWFADYKKEFDGSKDALKARSAADAGFPARGTAAYTTLLEKYRGLDIVKGGGAFKDASNLYHIEGLFNFKNQIKFIDLQVGANYRQYNLASEATLFADTQEGRNGSIPIPEYGAFVQASKSLFDDHLKLTASIRYDKSKNFAGQSSPRLSAVYSVGDHNFRISYQTGFRIPTTQNQYIDLKTPLGILIGGLPEFDARYGLAKGIDLYTLGQFQANPGKYVTADVLAKAQAYATAAVTANATPLITAGVNAAIKEKVIAAVTAGITDKVTAAVTAGIKDKVTAAVTAGITQQVTEKVTAGITQQVTAQVTTQVNALVAAGTLAANAAAAAITAGVAANLPAALTANLAGGVAANLPAALAANLDPQVAANLPAALAANLAPQVAAVLPAQLAANLDKTVEAQLPGVLAANFKPAFDAELAKALTANVPALTGQLAPAYALATLAKYQAKTLVPEKIIAYEVGYKGLFAKKLFVDAYYYTSKYKNFIGGTTILVPLAAAGPGLPIESGIGAGLLAGYSRPSNTSNDITSSGFALSANYSLAKGFNIGLNFAQNNLDGFTASPQQQYAGYNTPKNRYNISFGKRLTSGTRVAYNISLRNQDAFTWESSFVQPSDRGQISFTNTQVAAITNLDAQVSIKMPSIKSVVKIGGTNIGGKPYVQAYGSAAVGSMYYISVSFDELLNK
jgi:iron complex outermembrane recepter protein